jgi:predicted metal-binding membrane protein
MVAFQAVVFCSLLVLMAVALVSPPLVIVGFAVGLVVWLLVYLTPFLVVVADLPLLAAFRRSVRLATGRIEPVAFAAGYALVVAVVSVPVSVITNAGIPGVVLAAAIVSPIGLFLSALTVRFTRALLPSVDHDRTTTVHGTD